MKIAIIVESFPSLSETFVLNHIKGLLDAGIEVKIFSYNRPGTEKIHRIFFDYRLSEKTFYMPERKPGNLSYAVQLTGQALSVLLKSPGVFVRMVKQVAKKRAAFPVTRALAYVNRQAFDLVHCHFGTMAKDLLMYRELGFKSLPVVTTFHGYDIDSAAIRNDKSFYNELIRRGDLFIANSSYTRNRLVESGFPEKKIAIVPVSLDTAKFSPGRNKYTDDPGKKLVIVTVGRLVDFKGHKYALEAIALLVRRGIRKVEYRIIGDGPLREELQERSASLKLADTVRFFGGLSQEELIAELRLADIFLLSGIRSDGGREENQGLVIQEAQSMELPVVVSDVGGVKEGMTDGVTGYLVQQKDVHGIAGALEKLIADPALRARMGSEGRAFVENKYSIEATTRTLTKLYEGVLSRQRR